MFRSVCYSELSFACLYLSNSIKLLHSISPILDSLEIFKFDFMKYNFAGDFEGLDIYIQSIIVKFFVTAQQLIKNFITDYNIEIRE